jgi:hypothetical protein
MARDITSFINGLVALDATALSSVHTPTPMTDTQYWTAFSNLLDTYIKSYTANVIVASGIDVIVDTMTGDGFTTSTGTGTGTLS